MADSSLVNNNKTFHAVKKQSLSHAASKPHGWYREYSFDLLLMLNQTLFDVFLGLPRHGPSPVPSHDRILIIARLRIQLLEDPPVLLSFKRFLVRDRLLLPGDHFIVGLLYTLKYVSLCGVECPWLETQLHTSTNKDWRNFYDINNIHFMG